MNVCFQKKSSPVSVCAEKVLTFTSVEIAIPPGAANFSWRYFYLVKNPSWNFSVVSGGSSFLSAARKTFFTLSSSDCTQI
jgi:hypothetical protein